MSHRRTLKAIKTRHITRTGIGTIHKFHAVAGTDRIIKNGIQTQIRTKLYNLCAMTAYENKSMEELRFEDYIVKQKYSSLYTTALFGASVTNLPESVFGSNMKTTSSTLGLSLFENKSIVSTAPTFSFSFDAPTTAPAAMTKPFTFCPSGSVQFSSFVPTTSISPFIFGSGQPTSMFDSVLPASELRNHKSNSDEETASTFQSLSIQGITFTRPPSPEIVRICADCKKLPHMQCLHCSKQVCLDCAKEHVALATKQVDVAQHDLNDKMSILDRLADAAKERVNIECDKIKQGIDTERDQAFAQIEQLLEQQKKQIQDKSSELSQLSLDKIASYIQRMTSEIENLTEDNHQLFCVTCTPPKIQVQHKT